MAYDIAEQVLGIAFQSFEFIVVLADDVRLRNDVGAKKWAQSQQLFDANPLQTFHEDDHIAVWHLDGLVNLRERADFVQVGSGGIFDARIELGHYAEQFLLSG